MALIRKRNRRRSKCIVASQTYRTLVCFGREVGDEILLEGCQASSCQLLYYEEYFCDTCILIQGVRQRVRGSDYAMMISMFCNFESHVEDCCSSRVQRQEGCIDPWQLIPCASLAACVLGIAWLPQENTTTSRTNLQLPSSLMSREVMSLSPLLVTQG
jgi:hypothetical protein